MREATWNRSPAVIVGIGAVLFLSAVGHHTREYLALGSSTGPLIALLLDGVPALVLAYGGLWLYRTDLSPPRRRTVFGWCVGGGSLFVVVMAATFLVRALEGRAVAEPVFPLLIAFEIGALAGLIAGYSTARARLEAARARTVTDALAFVNRLIRHDLKNDLTTIKTYADIGDGDGATVDAQPGHASPAVIDEKTTEALDRIETSRAITDTLVGDPEFEPVDLVPIVTELATRVEETFHVSVDTEFDADVVVRGNAGIRSVVDNLLENAAEHNDANEPRIHVAVETEADTVELRIADNGPGIPDPAKRTLFESDEDEAAGGLALVHRLVGQYDGSLRVEDNEPRGTRFVVTFPRATDASRGLE